MKDYQIVIDSLFAAATIVIAGTLIVNLIRTGFESLRSAINHSAELL